MKRLGVMVLVGLSVTSLANAQEWPQFSSVSDPEVVRAGVFADSVVGERAALVTRSPTRYQLLTWDGTRFAASRWARRRPALPR